MVLYKNEVVCSAAKRDSFREEVKFHFRHSNRSALSRFHAIFSLHPRLDYADFFTLFTSFRTQLRRVGMWRSEQVDCENMSKKNIAEHTE